MDPAIVRLMQAARREVRPLSRWARPAMTGLFIAMVALALLFAMLVFGWASSARAEVPSDVKAFCTSDAVQLCPMRTLLEAWRGNYGGIDYCFRRNRDKLSDDCKTSLIRWRLRSMRRRR